MEEDTPPHPLASAHIHDCMHKHTLVLKQEHLFLVGCRVLKVGRVCAAFGKLFYLSVPRLLVLNEDDDGLERIVTRKSDNPLQKAWPLACGKYTANLPILVTVTAINDRQGPSHSHEPIYKPTSAKLYFSVKHEMQGIWLLIKLQSF